MGRIQYFSTVFGELGGMLIFISPITVVPLIVSLVYREWDMLIPMGLVPVLFFSLGVLLNRLPRKSREVRLSAALCSVALVWLTFAAVSSIPFMLTLHISFTDALFEGMAGWTGTGFTLLRNLNSIPMTLIFWRTFMQWIGGLGIIALTITMVNRSGLSQSPLFRADSRNEQILPNVIATGRQIWVSYIILTAIAIVLVLIAGIPVWDAVNIGLSAISTGGFTPQAGGIIAYHNPLLEYLLIPVMIIGSTPFILYYTMYRKRKIALFGDEQVKILFTFLLFGALIVISDLLFISHYAWPDAVRQGLFMTAAAISTTGFQNGNPHAYASVTVVFLTMLMFIGGSSGSTAGGVKLSRIALGYRGLIWWFRRAFVRGKVLVAFKYEGRTIPDQIAEPELAKNMLVIILAVLTIFVGTMIILQFHIISFGLTELVFDIVSAFSSCGLTTGYVSPTMPLISKWVFIFVMWIGRVEVIPVIVLFLGLFRGSER
jgi:trk system potassium uptake protein TrkH